MSSPGGKTKTRLLALSKKKTKKKLVTINYKCLNLKLIFFVQGKPSSESDFILCQI